MTIEYKQTQGAGINWPESQDQGGQWHRQSRDRRGQDCIQIRIQFTTLQWTNAGDDITLEAQPESPPAFFSPSDSDANSRVELFSSLRDIPIYKAHGEKLG